MSDSNATRFVVTIRQGPVGTDIVRVVRQDDYDVGSAIEQTFREVRQDAVVVHMPASGKLTVTVERVK